MITYLTSDWHIILQYVGSWAVRQLNCAKYAELTYASNHRRRHDIGSDYRKSISFVPRCFIIFDSVQYWALENHYTGVLAFMKSTRSKKLFLYRLSCVVLFTV